MRTPGPVAAHPLALADLPRPEPRPNERLLRVKACGVCHTDLHIVEGELTGKLPLVPGHQVVGIDEQTGERLGVPWLHRACGICEFCRTDRENLCEQAQFTGLHVNGGYAEYAVVPAEFAVQIPAAFDDAHAAPLLCAGIIGYRALRLSNIQPHQRLGLYGFGASAHIAVQIARHWGCEVFVSTRSPEHQALARELGATLEIPANSLDSAIIFAPAGPLVPVALRALRKGGTLALAGIYMSPIPELPYELLYHERTIRSVANATRDDARHLMRLAAEIPLRTQVQTFPLREANEALLALKQSRINGAGVLVVE